MFSVGRKTCIYLGHVCRYDIESSFSRGNLAGNVLINNSRKEYRSVGHRPHPESIGRAGGGGGGAGSFGVSVFFLCASYAENY